MLILDDPKVTLIFRKNVGQPDINQGTLYLLVPTRKSIPSFKKNWHYDNTHQKEVLPVSLMSISTNNCPFRSSSLHINNVCCTICKNKWRHECRPEQSNLIYWDTIQLLGWEGRVTNKMTSADVIYAKRLIQNTRLKPDPIVPLLLTYILTSLNKWPTSYNSLKSILHCESIKTAMKFT